MPGTPWLESCVEWFRPHSMLVAGVLFGAGLWCWGDSVTVTVANGEHKFSPTWVAPGVITTLALALMNTVSRAEVTDSVYGDDATLCRSRCTLVLSYALSTAGIVTAVAVLLSLKAAGDEHLWIGVASIIQACLFVAAGLVAWIFKEGEGDDLGYSYM